MYNLISHNDFYLLSSNCKTNLKKNSKNRIGIIQLKYKQQFSLIIIFECTFISSKLWKQLYILYLESCFPIVLLSFIPFKVMRTGLTAP